MYLIAKHWLLRYNYITCIMDRSVLNEIERKLHYTFSNKNLLAQAFTHSSYANVENVADNERMEFLGDAILGYLSSEYLYSRYGSCSEGSLSPMRSKIVSAEGLYPIVEKLELLKYLRIASNAGANGVLSHKMGANLYEAVLCAIYLDGGIDSAKDFVLRTMGEILEKATDALQKDSKTKLQEFCQKNRYTLEYKSIGRTGPDNKPTFSVAIFINGKQESVGEGASKKVAEQDAASKIITEWRID